MWRRSPVSCAAVVALVSTLALAGCVSNPRLDPRIEASVGYLEGRVAYQPVEGALVEAFVLEPDGSIGARLGPSVVTNETGRFSLVLDEFHPGAILVRATGGHFVDAASYGSTSAGPGESLDSIAVGVENSWVTISPLTHMAAKRARVLASEGTSLERAVASSTLGVAQQFLIENPVAQDPFATLDLFYDAPRTSQEIAYEAILAGFSYLAGALGTTPPVLAQALAEDASDGLLDGRSERGSVRLSSTQPEPGAPVAARIGFQPIAPDLPATAGTLQWAAQVEAVFAGNPQLGPALPMNIHPVRIGSAGNEIFVGATPALPTFRFGGETHVDLLPQGNLAGFTCSAPDAFPVGFQLQGCTLVGNPPLRPSGTTKTITSPFTIRFSDPAGVQASFDMTYFAIIAAGGPYMVPDPHGAICYLAVECNGFIAAGAGGATPLSFRMDTLRYGAPPFGTRVGSFPPGANGEYRAHIVGTPKALGGFQFNICVVDLVGEQECEPVYVYVLEEEPLATEPSADEEPDGDTVEPRGGAGGSGRDYLGTLDFEVTIREGTNFSNWAKICTTTVTVEGEFDFSTKPDKFHPKEGRVNYRYETRYERTNFQPESYYSVETGRFGSAYIEVSPKEGQLQLSLWLNNNAVAEVSAHPDSQSGRDCGRGAVTSSGTGWSALRAGLKNTLLSASGGDIPFEGGYDYTEHSGDIRDVRDGKATGLLQVRSVS